MHDATSRARLDRICQGLRKVIGVSRDPGRSSRDLCGVATRLFVTFAKRGSPGLAFRDFVIQVHAWWPESLCHIHSDGQRVGARRCVRNSGTGRNNREIVAWYIGDRECNPLAAGAAAIARRPPLIADKCFSQRVDFGDMRAAFQQRAG